MKGLLRVSLAPTLVRGARDRRGINVPNDDDDILKDFASEWGYRRLAEAWTVGVKEMPRRSLASGSAVCRGCTKPLLTLPLMEKASYLMREWAKVGAQDGEYFSNRWDPPSSAATMSSTKRSGGWWICASMADLPILETTVDHVSTAPMIGTSNC